MDAPGNVPSEGSPELSPDASAPAGRLSAELARLSAEARGRGLRLGALIRRLQGRVYTLLLVLLAAPFCQPIALPGLSTPFGVVIGLLGLRFAFRQTPWLPRRLLLVRIPARVLPGLLQGAAKILRAAERFLHPRLGALFAFRATHFLAGLTIAFCGALLLLPLPIPFSNLLPALTVVLLALAMAERDGVILLVGAAVFLVTLLFFAGIFLGGYEAIEWIEARFSGFFDPDDEAPGLIAPPSPTAAPAPTP